MCVLDENVLKAVGQEDMRIGGSLRAIVIVSSALCSEREQSK
jgi:hypothetical protein